MHNICNDLSKYLNIYIYVCLCEMLFWMGVKLLSLFERNLD
jgi:hypothetical protein